MAGPQKDVFDQVAPAQVQGDVFDQVAAPATPAAPQDTSIPIAGSPWLAAHPNLAAMLTAASGPIGWTASALSGSPQAGANFALRMAQKVGQVANPMNSPLMAPLVQSVRDAHTLLTTGQPPPPPPIGPQLAGALGIDTAALSKASGGEGGGVNPGALAAEIVTPLAAILAGGHLGSKPSELPAANMSRALDISPNTAVKDFGAAPGAQVGVMNTVRSTLDSLGIKPTDLPSLKAGVGQALSALETRFQNWLQPIADVKPALSGQRISDALMEKANAVPEEFRDTPAAAAYYETLKGNAESYLPKNGQLSLRGMNTQRMLLNDLNRSLESSTPGDASAIMRTKGQMAANKIVADTLRDIIYEEMDSAYKGNPAYGIGARALKQQQGSLRTVQDILDRRVPAVEAMRLRGMGQSPTEKLGVSAYQTGDPARGEFEPPRLSLHRVQSLFRSPGEAEATYANAAVRRAFDTYLPQFSALRALLTGALASGRMQAGGGGY